MKMQITAVAVLVTLVSTTSVHAEVSKLLNRLPGVDKIGMSALNREMNATAYNTVYFDFDRDFLDGEARARIRQQAAFIQSKENIRFAVTGHTDKVGNQTYNKDLGLRRANRVVNELVSLGVDRDRLVAMVSMGENDPLVDVETRERRNRRVTTRVLAPRVPLLSRGLPAPRDGSVQLVGAAETPNGADPMGDATQPEEPTTNTLDDTTTTDKPRPGNSAEGTGRPDAGSGNGNEPSGDPAGSVGHNKGGDETDQN